MIRRCAYTFFLGAECRGSSSTRRPRTDDELADDELAGMRNFGGLSDSYLMSETVSYSSGLSTKTSKRWAEAGSRVVTLAQRSSNSTCSI